jgi:glycosyltransferase involved in cell wall biosynthesis
MRVVLVHDWFTGVGQDLRTLQSLAALFPDSKIATIYYDTRYLPPDIARHRIQTSFLQNIPGRAKYSHHLMPMYPRAIKRFKFDNIDLMISNSQGFAKAANACATALNVCYFHQPMPLAWQPLEQQYPRNEINPLRYKFIENLAARFRQWDLKTAAGIGLFIASSESSQKLIKRLYDRPAKIIYPPVDTDYFTPNPDSEGGHFLIVGPLSRRRRIDIAIETFSDIKAKLVVVGEGDDFLRLVNMAPDNVSFTGHIDDDRLRQLYHDCRALIVTSQSDFSMAAVEAAACGKPVICFSDSGIRETLGEQKGVKSVKLEVGKYGVFVEGRSPLSLKESIKAFRESQFDREQLRNNALRFSKQVFFQNMRDFLMEAYSLFRRDSLVKLEQRLLG